MSEAEEKRLAAANLGLVRMCATRFKGRGIEYEELYSAGCLGLVKAAKNFNPGLGFAFSTYAVPVILGEIKRCFREGGDLKVSRTIKEKAREVNRVLERLEVALGHSVDMRTLAEECKMTVFEVAELLSVSTPVMSLNDKDGGIEVPDASFESETIDRLTVEDLLNRLDKSDSELIKLRYFKGLTQAETGAALGLSQVQVSRREKAALALMRSLAVA